MEQKIKIITYKGSPGKDAPDIMPRLHALESSLREFVATSSDSITKKVAEALATIESWKSSQELANGLMDSNLIEIENKVSEIIAELQGKTDKSDFEKLASELTVIVTNLNSVLNTKADKSELKALEATLRAVIPSTMDIVANSSNVHISKDGSTYGISVDVPEITREVTKEVIQQSGGGVSSKKVQMMIDESLSGYTPGTPGMSGDYLPLSGGTLTGTLAMSGAGIQLDTAHVPAWSEGKIFYDSQYHTLAYYNDNSEVTIQVGQEEVVRVRNNTGATISNGKVVCINGSSGSHPLIILASNTSSTLSHSTLGVATHDINDNENGYITVSGLVNGLNTNSFSAAGVTLWLGTNGSLTETEPVAPNHKVKIGYLVRKHNNQGQILVTIDTGLDLGDLHDVSIGDYEDGALLVANGAVWSPGANVNDLATKSEVASISGALDTRIDLLEEINDKTGEPTGFVNRTSSTLSFNNANRTFTITGTHEVYCNGVKFTFGTTSQQITNTVHGMHFFWYSPTGVFTYSAGVPWSIENGDAMIAAVYWDATNQLGVLIEERHGCVMDAATHYYNHSLFGTQRITAGAIGGYTIQTNSNASLQVAVGATTLADEDITYTTISNLIAGSYRFARRNGTGSDWVVNETNTNPFISSNNNIKYNQLNGSTWQMTEVTTNNSYINYYIVVSTAISGAYSYLLVPGQVTYSSLALAQGESFNNLNLTGFPFIEFNALYQMTFRYNTSHNNITGRARLEANPVLLGLRSATQVVAPVSTHNALSGLQGGTVNEYFHLTSDQANDFIGRTEVASISGSLSSNINTRALDSNVVHTTGSETISGNKTFVNSISCMRGTNLHNEAFGVNTMVSIIDAQDNTAVGYGSSQLLTTGKNNVSVGFNALNKNKVGNDNVAIGSQALINYLGDDNIAIGKSALYTTTGGSANTAVGNSALQNNTTGYFNTAMGRESLTSNAGGSQNTGYGFQSLGGNWTASNNTGVGYRSLFGISTGGNNTAIGFESGYNSSVGAATNCIFVGYNAKPTVDSITNSICIGASTSISASNQVIVGNSNITSTKLRGVVTANDNNVNVIVELSGAPTPTTTRVKGNIGYYGGYIYIWTSDSVVVRNAVETTW